MVISDNLKDIVKNKNLINEDKVYCSVDLDNNIKGEFNAKDLDKIPFELFHENELLGWRIGNNFCNTVEFKYERFSEESKDLLVIMFNDILINNMLESLFNKDDSMHHLFNISDFEYK